MKIILPAQSLETVVQLLYFSMAHEDSLNFVHSLHLLKGTVLYVLGTNMFL